MTKVHGNLSPDMENCTYLGSIENRKLKIFFKKKRFILEIISLYVSMPLVYRKMGTKYGFNLRIHYGY